MMKKLKNFLAFSVGSFFFVGCLFAFYSFVQFNSTQATPLSYGQLAIAFVLFTLVASLFWWITRWLIDLMLNN